MQCRFLWQNHKDMIGEYKMSMFKSRNKGENSTMALIGIEKITDYSLKTKSEELVLFLIKPTNVSVLSDISLNERIFALTTLIKGIGTLEFLCFNSKENFDENKIYLSQRLQGETNPKIRNLLLKDCKNLDKIQTQMATAREFAFLIRVKNDENSNALSYLQRIEKNIDDQGFTVKMADEADLKRILSVYFEQNVAADKYQNFDGEQWISQLNL